MSLKDKRSPIDITQILFENTSTANRAVLVDSAGTLISSTNPLPVDTEARVGVPLTSGQVTLTSTAATQIISTNSNREGVLVYIEDEDVFIGNSSVTTNSGHKVLDGLWISIPSTYSVHGAVTGGTGTAYYLEV